MYKASNNFIVNVIIYTNFTNTFIIPINNTDETAYFALMLYTDEGHEDIGDKGGGDLGERAADDDTDGHVEDVTAHDEFLEFLQHDRYLPLMFFM